MFNQSGYATAVMAFIVLCSIIIIVLIGFDSTKAVSWGDVFMLLSIFAAGFIAFRNLNHAKNHAEKERERIAYARAKTLFRECEINHIPAAKTLCLYLQLKGKNSTFPGHFEETLWLVKTVEGTLRKDRIKFSEADTLYMHQNDLGDAATNVIIAMQQLDYMIKNFIKDYAEEYERIINKIPQKKMGNDEMNRFKEVVNALMSKLAEFLRNLETFKSCQPNIVYRQSKTEEVLEELATVAINQARAPNKPIKTYDSIELFSALHEYFKS